MRRILPFVLILIAACPACGSDYSARVVGFSDGHTITVLKDRTQVRIRLHGIDAPETGQDFGSRAKQLASKLAFGKTVKIQVRDTDRYGRTVADVILPDGRSLNKEMVREGMAWWYRRVRPVKYI
jgi:micrococcal nuclease